EALGNRIKPVCEAARGKCDVDVRELLYDVPLKFPQQIRDGLARVCDRLAIPHMEIQSPAGHDARYLHYVCPTGMIFIPCKDGI
ncbi:M20/M25/M40 family metallo-hydrolase, partial [Klebsiella pneumoniae]|nr:M20/M25/M40 family metallo-hydrolase [Klebsiella pneumoniae]